MSLNRTTCPQCGAALKSAVGFKPGQKVRCPKCEVPFEVAAEPQFEEVTDDDTPPPAKKPLRAGRPVPDDDDDRPRRKRRRDDDDDDDDDDRPRKKKKAAGGYKNSPLRYAILGVLLVVMGVLAFMLYKKKQDEAEADRRAEAAAKQREEGGNFQVTPPIARKTPGPNAGGGGGDGIPPRGGPARDPAADETPEVAAVTARAVNDVKQLGLALHNFHDVTGALPPPAVVGKDGKALLSWRVAVLPYIEQDSLYKQFKLDEAWDGPNNIKLLPLMPRTFRGTLPTADGKTAIKVFAGRGSAFDPTRKMRFQEITDGTSNTIGLIEAGDPVEWTRPLDIPFDGKTAPQITSPSGRGYVILSTLDGFTRKVSLTTNTPDTFLKAAGAQDGFPVQLE